MISVIVYSSRNAQGYDLGKTVCGLEYGGISLFYPPGVTTFSQIKEELSSISWAKTPYLDVSNAQMTSLDKEIIDSFKEGKSRPGGGYDISVPIGSEEYIAKTLVDKKIIRKATLIQGFCAGSDVIYISIDNTLAGNVDLFEGSNFENFFLQQMKTYVNSGSFTGSVIEGQLHVAPIEPRMPTKDFTIIVPSEVSRKYVKTKWDKFEVFFTGFVKKNSKFIVVMHVEKLRVAPRTPLRSETPSKEHFRALDEGESDKEEYIVTTSVARFIANDPKKCEVQMVMMDEKMSPFKCTVDNMLGRTKEQ